jgi:hypothetical protein
MSEKTNCKFNYRAFVSVLSAFTFAAMAITGLVMFFAPSCRIARDSSWTVWGQSKEQWTAVHVWFSIAFVIASAFHIYLNWAVLTCYFKNKLRQGFALRTEWIVALVICGVIGLGTVYEVAPFSSLLTWKETFKRSEFGGGGGQGGYRGGRGTGLRQGTFGLPASTTDGSIPAQGCEQGAIGAYGTAAISRGAGGTCLSSGQPQVLTQQPQQESTYSGTQVQGPAVSSAGFGMGQKTLSQYCTEQGIELSWAISRLKSKGFTAKQTMTMRQIADSAGVHPRELRIILQP